MTKKIIDGHKHKYMLKWYIDTIIKYHIYQNLSIRNVQDQLTGNNNDIQESILVKKINKKK